MAQTHLYAGDAIARDGLVSSNGLFEAFVDNQGQFAVFRYDTSSDPPKRTAVWSIGARYPQPGSRLFVHPEGRMELINPNDETVAYRGCADGANSYACLNNRDPFLVLHDDGNLVLYTRTPAGHRPITESGTHFGPAIWMTSTVPGVLLITLEDSEISSVFNKQLVNDYGNDVIVRGLASGQMLPKDARIGLQSPPGTLNVSTRTYIFDADSGESDAADATESREIADDEIKVSDIARH